VRKFEKLAKNYNFIAVSISYGPCRKLQSCSATHDASIGIFGFVQNGFSIFDDFLFKKSKITKKSKIHFEQIQIYQSTRRESPNNFVTYGKVRN